MQETLPAVPELDEGRADRLLDVGDLGLVNVPQGAPQGLALDVVLLESPGLQDRYPTFIGLTCVDEQLATTCCS